MGNWLARHLLSAGFSVLVHDIDPVKVEALVKEGGKTASAPDAIASEVDVVIMSLPSSSIVNEVVKDSLKLFETVRKGLIVIDATTADPRMSEELAMKLTQKGIEMLDAAISGTSEMCAVSSLSITSWPISDSA